jgi:hypothetical protein
MTMYKKGTFARSQPDAIQPYQSYPPKIPPLHCLPYCNRVGQKKGKPREKVMAITEILVKQSCQKTSRFGFIGSAKNVLFSNSAGKTGGPLHLHSPFHRGRRVQIGIITQSSSSSR